jgi:hypothetical protein
LNSQPVIVTVIDPSTYRGEFQNQTGLGKFGDIGGKSCHSAIAGSDSPCGFCRMGETLRTGELTTNEVPLPNGQTLLVGQKNENSSAQGIGGDWANVDAPASGAVWMY